MHEELEQFIKAHIKNDFLLITCGLPGTGKSSAAEAVQRLRGGGMLKTDMIRREVLKNVDVFDFTIAGDMVKRTKVYDIMFRQAAQLMKRENNFYLDATFINQELRKRAAALAAENWRTLIIMETVCPEEVCLGRITGRDKNTSVSNAVTEEAYYDNKKRYEPVDLGYLKKLYPNLDIQHITVDTSAERPYVIAFETR